MAISLVLGLICLFCFWFPETSIYTRLGVLFSGLNFIGLVVCQFGLGVELEADLRWRFFKTTLKAATDYWVMGSGLGSFTYIYPAYQPREEIVGVVANYAHIQDKNLQGW